MASRPRVLGALARLRTALHAQARSEPRTVAFRAIHRIERPKDDRGKALEQRTNVAHSILRYAEQLGLFGVPTFAFRGEMFWGNDRPDLLANRLSGDRN